eukprot:TRINITY_DN169_c2_g1_i8.p1 TRINITY_DN169_c2_g1~~TRINITY_DN169_c2_g1_i8.p1  ORF type:complete len:108 (+),score=12.17 TRINITY_DN169_c2_g1_i8:494-817(+)
MTKSNTLMLPPSAVIDYSELQNSKEIVYALSLTLYKLFLKDRPCNDCKSRFLLATAVTFVLSFAVVVVVVVAVVVFVVGCCCCCCCCCAVAAVVAVVNPNVANFNFR